MFNRLKKLGILLGNVVQFVCIPFVWWIGAMDQMLSGPRRVPASAAAHSHSGHTCKTPSIMTHQDVIKGSHTCECGAVLKVITGCSDVSQLRGYDIDPKVILASCNTKIFFALDEQPDDGKPA